MRKVTTIPCLCGRKPKFDNAGYHYCTHGKTDHWMRGIYVPDGDTEFDPRGWNRHMRWLIKRAKGMQS